MDTTEIILRILLAMAIGGIIGWEREKSNRPAGLRTHMLVSIGAAVVMMLGEISLLKYANITTMDPTRLGAQVISGIGFLGAGTIMREGLTVRGLTTAASLWAVACMGLAAGGGFYEVAIAGTLAIILTLTIFEYLENKLKRDKGIHIELKCVDVSATLLGIKRLAASINGILYGIDISEEQVGDKIIFYLVCKLRFEKPKKNIDYSRLTADLSTLQGVSMVKVQEY